MTQTLHPVLAAVTDRIRARSQASRAAYLEAMNAARRRGNNRHNLACANFAHVAAAAAGAERAALRARSAVSIGIVTAYNDMLSAHQPLQRFPAVIKLAALAAGGVAQVAGGVPAMCDGVTQGEPGMELSLFSRDVIALATAVALSHNTFDAAMCLGVCDKIVPGLLIAAARFGHLPIIFVPGGPMPSGLPNREKARMRELATAGKISRDELQDAELQSYHAPGTCTFYGTANTNQMLMEIMGLHLPGASFVAPGDPLRDALTGAATRQLIANARQAPPAMLADILDARAFANGIVGLLATGGSTNHLLHLVAMAAAAGLKLDWQDFDDLSHAVPLLARVYPNGSADVNAFHQAGGMAFLIGQLLAGGLLHADVQTVAGPGLQRYTEVPRRAENDVVWEASGGKSGDEDVLRPISRPFAPDGGLRLLGGNLGRAVIKVSAVPPEHHVVEAPVIVFHSQDEVQQAFEAGRLERDFIALVRFQGPRANGMPELHKLVQPLGVLQGRGFHVALLTDGRMSGASGKVPAAIHVSPEAALGGAIARLRDGDVVRIDAPAGQLTVRLSEADLMARPMVPLPPEFAAPQGQGRELFALFRDHAAAAEHGGGLFGNLV